MARRYGFTTDGYSGHCPPRYSTPRTESRQTLGAYAGQIAEAIGTPLMDWQRHVLDVGLELVEVNGSLRFAYRKVILTVPRQSGKTTLMLVLMLTRALSERTNIRFAMQSYVEAQGKLVDDWLPNLQHTDVAALYKPTMTNGQHGLKFPETGSAIKIISSTKTSGHGTEKLGLAILDEAFAQKDARFEQAMSPATSTTGGKSQLWYVSTAGPMDGSAEWFREKCEAGRLAVDTNTTEELAYFEWSADPDADITDAATWRSCMPALGVTQEESFIRSESAEMQPVEFRRAYLNQWTTSKHQPIIDLAEWQALATEDDSDVSGAVALSFDVTPDNSWSSIAGASTLGQLDHLDVIDHQRGTDWLRGRLTDLVSRHNVSAVVYDPQSPAAAVAASITDQTVRSKLVAASARDFGEACQMITTGVTDRTLGHSGDPDVLTALDGAGKRPLNDLWRWSRTSTTVDISPLVAVTLALWGHRTHKPRGIQFFEIDLSGQPSDEAPQAGEPGEVLEQWGNVSRIRM